MLTLPVRRARLLRLTRSLQLLLSRPILLTGLLLSGTVLQSRLLLPRTIWRARLLAGAVLSRQTILLRAAARRVATVEAGVGAAEVALLVEDAAAEILRRVNLTHKTLIAQHLLRRNRQRHRGKARAAAPGRIVKPLEPWLRKPSRAPARSLTSMRPTLPSASG